MYEKIRQDHGYDPLRVPSWAFTKGMGRTRTAEEYGFQTRESAIQRFTESLLWVKLAERGFVTGTNDMNWDIWNRYYDSMVRVSEKIASGETKLEEGKVFSIEKEMIDCQRYLSLMTQRASLGKAEALAPAASAVFFAPKNKLAKLIAPTTLFSSNPRIRAMAWKDWSLFVTTFGGLVMAGAFMGIWDVDKDPRSANFMSIRIGNTRIDPWAGYRQYVNLYARLVTRTGIDSTTGREYEVNPGNALWNFVQSY